MGLNREVRRAIRRGRFGGRDLKISPVSACVIRVGWSVDGRGLRANPHNHTLIADQD